MACLGHIYMVKVKLSSCDTCKDVYNVVKSHSSCVCVLNYGKYGHKIQKIL